MYPGQSKTFPLSAAEAFGPYDETGRLARILKILPEKTLLDLNHPLAGKPLIVTSQIMTIENPD
jgi:FKBP-type peptidyl-prolyl cis-trans isomerase 2